MVHTGGMSFAVQRKIDQLPNRTIDQSTKPLFDVIILYGGRWKIRIAVTKEVIKTISKTRSNFHPVLKLNYFIYAFILRISLRGVVRNQG